jgi:preprotein translocase subunit SecG
MFAALVVLHVIVSVLLVLVVLLQSGRGAELGAAFGSVGQATFGRGRPTFLSRFTKGLAVVFMSTSLVLAFMSNEAPSRSVLSTSESETGAPPGSQPAALPQSESAPAQNLPAPAGQPPAAAGEQPAVQPTLPQQPAPLQPTDAPPANRQ